MRKIVLTLILLLTFGLSYGTNPNEVKNKDNNFFYDELTITTENNSEISLVNIISVEEVSVVDCIGVGAAFYAVAIQEGYSEEQAWNIGVTAMNVCNALVLIGNYL